MSPGHQPGHIAKPPGHSTTAHPHRHSWGTTEFIQLVEQPAQSFKSRALAKNTELREQHAVAANRRSQNPAQKNETKRAETNKHTTRETRNTRTQTTRPKRTQHNNRETNKTTRTTTRNKTQATKTNNQTKRTTKHTKRHEHPIFLQKEWLVLLGQLCTTAQSDY